MATSGATWWRASACAKTKTPTLVPLPVRAHPQHPLLERVARDAPPGPPGSRSARGWPSTAGHALTDFLAAPGEQSRETPPLGALGGRAREWPQGRRLRLRAGRRPPPGRAARRHRARRAPATQLRHRPGHDRAARRVGGSCSWCRTRTPTARSSPSTTPRASPRRSSTAAARAPSRTTSGARSSGTSPSAHSATASSEAARAAPPPRSLAPSPRPRTLSHGSASTFPNIRFSVDLQANGGYLTWSPGAYIDNGSRTPLPSKSALFDDYMAATAAPVANVAVHRGRTILPPTGQRMRRELLGSRRRD